jgi:hypothetical protein
MSSACRLFAAQIKICRKARDDFYEKTFGNWRRSISERTHKLLYAFARVARGELFVAETRARDDEQFACARAFLFIRTAG